MSDAMIDEFMIEAEEMFEEAEVSLLALDKGGDFKTNYNNIFRAFHSIKGAAGMFYLNALKEHMHRLENTFEGLKNNTNLSKDEIDYFLGGVDAARSILNGEEILYPPLGEATESPKVNTERIEEKLQAKEYLGLIYVVDDENLICDALKDILESVDLEVEIFSNAKDAITRIQTRTPDLLFTDIKMPEMTGVELIKELERLKISIPTVLVSSYITKQVCIEVIGHGAYGIIEKPFDEQIVQDVAKKGVKKSKSAKLVNKSVNLLMYQFSDLSEFLEKNGKQNIKKSIEDEIKHILNLRATLNKLGN